MKLVKSLGKNPLGLEYVMSKAKKKNLAPASDKLAKKQAKAPKRQQLAALCWRLREGEPEVLLITSRETGRWVVPKGWPGRHRQ